MPVPVLLRPMAATPPPAAPNRPPFGSWPRTYLSVCVLAVVVMVVLYWFSSHFNVRMPKS